MHLLKKVLHECTIFIIYLMGLSNQNAPFYKLLKNAIALFSSFSRFSDNKCA